MEEHAPLTFVGTVGSTYTVTVPVLGNMEFDRWDNGATDRTRSITLDQSDNTITAYLEVDSTNANATLDSRTIIIQRLADIVDQDNCFDTEDARRLNIVVGNMIPNMFSEGEGGSNQLQREINRLIVPNCPVVDTSASEVGQDNTSSNTEPSGPSGDEEEEEPSGDEEEEEPSGDEEEEEEE